MTPCHTRLPCLGTAPALTVEFAVGATSYGLPEPLTACFETFADDTQTFALFDTTDAVVPSESVSVENGNFVFDLSSNSHFIVSFYQLSSLTPYKEAQVQSSALTSEKGL